jgi:predicted MFS family arabinose efflux permease
MQTEPNSASPARPFTPEPYSSALGGLIALAAALGIGRFVYTPILPAMITALGLGRSSAGLIASANFLGYLFGAVLAAWPNLGGSRRLWLVGCLAISAITTGAMGLAHSLLPFVVLRCLGGAASAVVLVFATAMVLERLAEARRPGLSALHFAGVGTGIAASAILVAALTGAGCSWRSLWLGSGLLSLAGTLAAALLIREGAAHAPPAAARPQAGPATDPRLRRFITAYGLFGFGYVITATFIVIIVRGTPATSALEPEIWLVFGLAAAPSVVLWTLVSSRLGAPMAFALACLVEAGGVLASVAWPTVTGVFLAAILVGGTFMGLTALGLVQARALAPSDPRRALALMTGAFGLGQIAGPSFAGVVSDALGSFTVPSIAAAGALLIAGVLTLFPGRRRVLIQRGA